MNECCDWPGLPYSEANDEMCLCECHPKWWLDLGGES